MALTKGEECGDKEPGKQRTGLTGEKRDESVQSGRNMQEHHN